MAARALQISRPSAPALMLQFEPLGFDLQKGLATTGQFIGGITLRGQ